jgi:hypothetical protein
MPIALSITPHGRPLIEEAIDDSAPSLSPAIQERIRRAFAADPSAGLLHLASVELQTPSEIDMDCSCPDWAGMCKHVAAVLYGVGARLDHQPELLFKLRKVDHLELIAKAGDIQVPSRAPAGHSTLAAELLGDVFGIDLDAAALPAPAVRAAGAGSSTTARQAVPRGKPKSVKARIAKVSKVRRAAR